MSEEKRDKNELKYRCYYFSLKIISLLDDLPRKNSAKVIADQLMRSATSIGANMVEARASSSRLEYKKFFEISLKSANETKYWLGLLRDAKLSNEQKTNELLTEVEELANMIASGVIKLKSKLK